MSDGQFRVPKYVPNSTALKCTELHSNAFTGHRWNSDDFPVRILSPETGVRIPVAVPRFPVKQRFLGTSQIADVPEYVPN